MIKVLYFARLRERLNCESEEIHPQALQVESMTITNLIEYLAQRGEPWSEVFNNKQRILVAINQEISKSGATIKDNDEVAFMPPVTGG